MADKISSVLVVGAGQMGRGIAQVAMLKGCQVQLCDTQPQQLEQAKQFITKQLDRAVLKNKITKAAQEQALGRLKLLPQLKSLKEVQLVVEAATERLDVKWSILRELEPLLGKDVTVASNTSSISITHLASVLQHPQRMLGVHFMNPVPVMPLVEGISALQTGSEHVTKARKWVEEVLGKTWVLSKDVSGFVVNRILMPMINEAVYALHERVAPRESIDTAMKLGTRHPMGPLELADFIGLDTCLFILEVLHQNLGEDKYRPCPLLRQYVQAGWLGKKSGRGFYTYDGS